MESSKFKIDMKQNEQLHLLMRPSDKEGYVMVNPDFLKALKEEKARGETEIIDAFKVMVDCARKAVKEGTI